MKNKEHASGIVLKIVIILAAVLVAAFSIYMLFIKQTNINCGVPTAVKESGRYVKVRISHDNKITWIKVPASYYSPDDGAYNIEKRGLKVVYMKPCDIYTDKILSISDTQLQTENKTIDLSGKVKFYKSSGNELKIAGRDDIVIGSSECRIILDDSGNAGAVIIGAESVDTVRVGISNSDFSSIDHSSLSFFCISEDTLTRFNSVSDDGMKWRSFAGEGMKVTGVDISYTLGKNEMLTAEYQDGYIVLNIYSISSSNQLEPKEEIGRTQSRVIVDALSDPLYVKNLKRSNGYKPTYYGSFEIYVSGSSMRLINEVDIEHYLRYIVPSQMVPSGGTESYKAQAVASRTAALYNILSSNHYSDGYHVSDSGKDLIYNAHPASEECSSAIDETAGEVITCNGKIIDARYYSTSCGTGASYNEIYYKGRTPSKNNPYPYLSSGVYTTPKVTDLKDDLQAMEFLKDWTIKSYDSNSPYYRWKFSMTRSELSDAINANIYSLYTKNPDMFRKATYFNIYKSTSIPDTGLGIIKNIEVSGRGPAGNVLSLTLTCDSGSYRVYGGENIQRLLTPSGLTVSLIYGSDTAMECIPSPYFAVDKVTSGSTLKSITVYGGGYGNGVGMSQYGVIGLVRSGMSYDEVLTTFYKGTDIKTLDELYPKKDHQ